MRFPPHGRVYQINVNPQGGVPKTRVPSAEVTTEGVIGDKQRDRRYHGGPERAVCLFSLERIQDLTAEGHSIIPGSVGENLTVSGLDWDTVLPGDRLRVGAVLLEITYYTPPCQKIRAAFDQDDFTRISQKLHPGWSRLYARVLVPGTVVEGDAVHHEPSTSGATAG